MDIYTQMEYIYIYISEQNAFNMFVNANNKIPSPFEMYNYNYVSRIFYSNRRTFSSRKIDIQDLIRNFSNSLKLFLSSYTVPR